MTPRRNSSLESTGSEESCVEDLVPTPIFSGEVQFNAPSAISFASATTKFASPMTHGTLMSDFVAEPRALRDWNDVFSTEGFTEMVITWPGLHQEWTIPMANVIGGKDCISRAELARLVVDQFNLFIVSASSCSSPEWRLGEAPNAYSTKNTSLAFLWSPAPGVWQPAFRVRNQFYNIKNQPSTT
ncbi:hypothetical protein BDM02DRAFT_3129603 [Thelephora ganbajun]|uniref:Uncharacterized protein n=1 Tax=Thelephora ganbajun TaxID=370292 RepID=A0ACB6ZDV8_THEGA|nr:hypothetical protein BDM02DRAFT_3129603 [Thelephora ganbajun]